MKDLKKLEDLNIDAMLEVECLMLDCKNGRAGFAPFSFVFGQGKEDEYK